MVMGKNTREIGGSNVLFFENISHELGARLARYM